MDKVSIIIAVYNVEDYILQCLSSIKAQTYENIEVLVIDDGSPDGSAKIIRPFLKDSRFHYYKKKNGGLSDARNYGMKKATGKYLAFVDSDDWIEPNYIEKLVSTLEKSQKPIAVCSFTREYKNYSKINKIDEQDVKLALHPAAWNKLYLKSKVDELNLEFPVGMWYEDLHFTTRFLLLNDFEVVKESLHHYRQNDSSIMHTYDERIFQIYDVIHDIEEFAHNKNIYNEKKDILEFININHILIGTIYRASFLENFSVHMISEIVEVVQNKYPNWSKNSYIKKEMPISYRIFLSFLKHHNYQFLAFMLRHFGKFVSM